MSIRYLIKFRVSRKKLRFLAVLGRLRYRPDPAKLFKTILIACKEQKRKENMEENKEKLIPIIVRIPKYKKEMLQKLASKQGRYEADVIRSGLEKELNIQIYKDNLDFIIKELDKMLDAKLKPFISSQRKINAKYLRTAAINTYLNGEIIAKLFGDDMHKEFIQMLTNARKKANYYINHDTEDMTKKDLFDFYTIGELYRNE